MGPATSPIDGVAPDAHSAISIDVQAAALFGPPDRQPAAMPSDEVLSGERGNARSDLEQSTWARWVPPSTAPPWPRG